MAQKHSSTACVPQPLLRGLDFLLLPFKRFSDVPSVIPTMSLHYSPPSKKGGKETKFVARLKLCTFEAPRWLRAWQLGAKLFTVLLVCEGGSFPRSCPDQTDHSATWTKQSAVGKKMGDSLLLSITVRNTGSQITPYHLDWCPHTVWINKCVHLQQWIRFTLDLGCWLIVILCLCHSFILGPWCDSG